MPFKMTPKHFFFLLVKTKDIIALINTEYKVWVFFFFVRITGNRPSVCLAIPTLTLFGLPEKREIMSNSTCQPGESQGS